jgi:Flp pilus assembly protein TadG
MGEDVSNRTAPVVRKKGPRRWITSFLGDGRAAVATVVALAIVPLAIAAGVAIDVGRAVAARTSLRTALDAAALAAAQEKSEAAALATVERYLRANYEASRWGALSGFSVRQGELTLAVDARATVPTTLLRVLGVREIEVGAEAEVTVGGANLEVALVLDVTGSMAQGTRIADLRAAATDLVNIVVRDVQAPFYSKVAIVPYSMGVNVGTLADTVRGPVRAGTCTTPGCSFITFKNVFNKDRTFAVSTCVSERIGPHAYTDAPPSTARVGYNYPAPGNPCLTSQIQPLTTDRTLLTARIASLTASGSTAGHVGIAWGWYTLSPNFGVWTGTSVPASYADPDTRKILVLMTDGEYNSSYCNGVISRTSTTGSGSRENHINCDAPNGHSFDQAQALCTAIKRTGITIFTVGFQIHNDPRARDLMSRCASSAEHAFTAETGAELRATFQQIAKRISKLRLSR